MNYSILPPEINSARIYFGAGSEPMLATAAAWDRLATELRGLYLFSLGYLGFGGFVLAGPRARWRWRPRPHPMRCG